MFGCYLILTILYNVFCVQCLSNVSVDNFQNLTADDVLWLNISKDCKEPTIGCLKTALYKFVKNTLEYAGDVQLTDFIKFSKNSNNFNENETSFMNFSNVSNETQERIAVDTPFEEMSRSLTSDTTKFLMTHDMEVHFPPSFFLGSTLKISPRSLEDNSALVKLEVVPRELAESAGTGRLFKKLSKYVNKLVT